MLNPRIGAMAPSAFMRLDAMMDGLAPAPGVTPLNLTLGDPQFPPPRFILDVFEENHALFGRYTRTDGTDDYRQAVLDWLEGHYGLPGGMIERDRDILPVAGLREGMFMIAQVVTPDEKAGQTPAVLIPNPFYHPYAGAAVAAHAEPVFVPALPENRFMPDFAGLDEATLARASAAYLCTPANPQGTAASLDYLCAAIELARANDFLLIVDECYAEIYFDERPAGAMEACARLGGGLANVVAFHSMSKRSSAPGLRSGFVVGDGAVLRNYLMLRNYGAVAAHPGRRGCAAARARSCGGSTRLLQGQLRRGAPHSRQPLRLLSARRRLLPVARRRRRHGRGAPAVERGRRQGGAGRADDPRGPGQRRGGQALHQRRPGQRPGRHHRGPGAPARYPGVAIRHCGGTR